MALGYFLQRFEIRLSSRSLLFTESGAIKIARSQF